MTFSPEIQFPKNLYHERCHLRRLEGYDFEQDMFSLAREPEVSAFLEWECHKNLKDTRSFLRYVHQQQSQMRGAYYAILVEENFAGVVSAEARSSVPILSEEVLFANRKTCKDVAAFIEFSTWLGKGFWGLGLGVLAKSMLLDSIRQCKQSVSVYSRIATANFRAKTAIQKLLNKPFLRCSWPLVIDGHAVETVLALLSSDDQHRTEKFEKFADRPKNFSQSEWDVLLRCPQTPALIYSLSACERNFKRLEMSLETIGGGAADIFFALKSCYVGPVIKKLKDLGGGVEVMSGLEMQLALGAGFEGKQILCNGLNKSVEYLWQAVEVDALVIIDAAEEVILLSQLAKRLGRVVRVGIRISVDLPQNLEGGYANEATKLGFELDENLLNVVLEWIAEDSFITLELLHAHTAHNAFSSAAHEVGLERLRQALDIVESRGLAETVKIIDIGGGWASDQPFENLSSDALKTSLLQKARKLFPLARIVVEPGRFLVHNSGFVVATVVATKKKKDRNFIVLDAGTNTLIPLPSNKYTILCPPGVHSLHQSANSTFLCDFVDGITSPSNVILQNIFVERLPMPGERVILGNCGAYTSVLAEFWAFDPIPVYISKDGQLCNFLSQDKVVAARSILLNQRENFNE